MKTIKVTYTAEKEGRPIAGLQYGTVQIENKFVNAKEGSYELRAVYDIITSAIENKYDCEVISMSHNANTEILK